jgi:hypothetical protein
VHSHLWRLLMVVPWRLLPELHPLRLLKCVVWALVHIHPWRLLVVVPWRLLPKPHPLRLLVVVPWRLVEPARLMRLIGIA